MKEVLLKLHKGILFVILFRLTIDFFDINLYKYVQQILTIVQLFLIGIVVYLNFFSEKPKEEIKEIFYESFSIILILIISLGINIFLLKNIGSIYSNLVILTILCLPIFFRKDIKNDAPKLKELFPERLMDKKRFTDLVKGNDERKKIIGMDGERGEGKTLLYTHLLEEIKNEFHIISIPVSDLEKSEIKPFLYNQLNLLLKKYGEYRHFFSQAKFDINFNFFSISNALSSNKTEYEKIEEAYLAINKLDKKVLIVVDDLDRESNCEKIESILNLIVNIVENTKKIKSLILLSRENLIKEQEKLTYEYIEKYIPTIEKITPLKFKVLLDHCLFQNKKEFTESDYKSVTKQIQRIIEESLIPKQHLDSLVDKSECIFQFENEQVKLSFRKATPRRVQNFIGEIIHLLKISRYEELQLNSSLIVNMAFIKVFFPEKYDLIGEHIDFDKFYDVLDLKFESERLEYEIDAEEYQNYYQLQKILEKDHHSIKNINREVVKRTINTFNEKYSKLGEIKINLKGIITYKNSTGKEGRKIEGLETFKLKNRGTLDFFVLQLMGIPIFKILSEDLKFRKQIDRKNSNIAEIKKIIFHGRNHLSNEKELFKQIEPHIKIDSLEERVDKINQSHNEWSSSGEKSIFYMGDSLGGDLIVHFLFLTINFNKKNYFYPLLECFFFRKEKITYTGLYDIFRVLEFNGLFKREIKENRNSELLFLEKVSKLEMYHEEKPKGIVINLKQQIIKKDFFIRFISYTTIPLIRQFNGNKLSDSYLSYGDVVEMIIYHRDGFKFTIEEFLNFLKEYKKDFKEESLDGGENKELYLNYLNWSEKELEKLVREGK